MFVFYVPNVFVSECFCNKFTNNNDIEIKIAHSIKNLSHTTRRDEKKSKKERGSEHDKNQGKNISAG